MKLTESTKNSIIDRTVRETLKSRREKLAKREDVLAGVIYSRLYPAEIIKKMNALPEEFFSQQRTMHLKDGARTFDLDLLSPRKVSAADSKSWKNPLLVVCSKKDSGLTREATTIEEKAAALHDDERALRKKLSLFLAGITTMKRLEETWPEGKKFYAEEAAPAPLANPPAIISAEIDAMITAIGKK